MTRSKFVFAVLIILIVALIIQIAWMSYNEDERKHELELNATWGDGWDIGYAWGAYNIFEEVMLKGFFAHNETWVLYSPGGCAQQVQAELLAKGCEVRCP